MPSKAFPSSVPRQLDNGAATLPRGLTVSYENTDVRHVASVPMESYENIRPAPGPARAQTHTLPKQHLSPASSMDLSDVQDVVRDVYTEVNKRPGQKISANGTPLPTYAVMHGAGI